MLWMGPAPVALDGPVQSVLIDAQQDPMESDAPAPAPVTLMESVIIKSDVFAILVGLDSIAIIYVLWARLETVVIQRATVRTMGRVTTWTDVSASRAGQVDTVRRYVTLDLTA